MTGSLLRSGKLTDYRALGDAGQKVFSAAAQIRQAVKYKVSPEAPAYLAIPQINDKGDTIDWYAPEAGDVVPWSAATPEEQADARQKLEQAQQALVETSQSIQQAEGQAAANDSEQQLFARLLDKVIHFPSAEHVYIVNGKPVLTFWGFSALNDEGGNSLDWLRPAPVSAPPVAPRVTAPVVADEPRRRFPWWWLLFALLLLLLLLWLLRGCWQDPAVIAPPTATDPAVTEQEPDTVEPDRDPAGVREVRDRLSTGVSGTGVAGSRTDAIGVGDPSAEGVTTDPEAALDQTLGEPPVPELPDELMPATEDPIAQDGPTGQEDPSSEQQTPQDPLAEQPSPEQQGEQGEQPQVPPPDLPDTETPADPAQQPPQQPLNIPQQAQQSGNTDFLNGGWQSNSGLQDSKTGQSMQMQYDFKDGQGQIRISGGNLSCEGPTSASMSQGSLTIPGTPVTCSDGTTITAPQVVCKPGQGGAADCTGSYEGGYSFPVNMNKSNGSDNP